MKRLPTDREILEAIYSRYYSTFVSFSKEKKERAAKIYVPVDLQAIADHLGIDGDIVFGRLYYYLEDKYGYKRDDGTRVHFFAFALGDDRHCVNFPLLASVLASLQIEHSRFHWATAISIVSILIALAALGVSAVSNLWLRPVGKPSQGCASQTLTPIPAFERTAASALRLLAVPSSRRSSAAAEGERWASSGL